VSRTAALLVIGAAAFAVLATANSGGYRYGVSDQAFYVPAVLAAGDPALFPRDRDLLATQTGFMAADDLLASVAAMTGADLPMVFLAAYVVTLLALFGAGAAFARRLGLSWWATAAALALLTFRHRIAKTGANTLEGYFHPRQLAFAIGVWAWVLLLRGRPGWALAATAAAGLIHPTTAIWFGVTLVVAMAIRYPRARTWIAAAATAFAVVAAWMLIAGPMSGRLVRMDEPWLAVLAGKDYLFPADWPAYAWLTNLAYPAIVVLVFRSRRQLGLVGSAERGVVWGLMALVAMFLVSVPLTEMRIAFAVQMQVNRIFWLLDFVVAIYLAWWLTSRRSAGRRTAMAVALVLITLSAGRSAYLLTVTHGERRLVQAGLPDTPWTDAMRWIRSQPADWHVLADPEHGWRYGISVRVAAARDTVVETSKDTAMAMYDRRIAMRVAERLAALAGLTGRSADDLRTLGSRYDVDVAVLEHSEPVDLPVLYRNSQFVAYDLR
jgi:hypothetical protein